MCAAGCPTTGPTPGSARQRRRAPRHVAIPLTLALAVTVVSVAACDMGGDDVTETMGRSTVPSSGPSDAQPIAQLPRPPGGSIASAMTVSPHQRAYLDALGAAGVDPSSELVALSIGSYVCQARRAHQSDQAVWDFVLPMVRDDVRDTTPGNDPIPVGQVDSVTADYIRIATDRLC